MKQTLSLGTLSIVVSAFLVGCGSDSSSTDTSVSTAGNSLETTQVAASSMDKKTGYFIDAAVEGVEYNTSSGLFGTTDAFGRFQYEEGDKVRLYIGKLLLGEAAPTEEGLVTPRTLSEGDEEVEVLLLRTLQALDVDNNLSNGITIPDNLLEDIEETSIEDQNESSLVELGDLGEKLDHDYDGEIDVAEADAKAHFENSEEAWDEGKRPDEGHEEEPLNGQANGNGAENGHGESAGNETNSSSESDHVNEFNLSVYSTSVLSDELKQSLAYMGNEERLAYDVYHNLYNYHVTENATEINQLKNISERSEIEHVGIVQDLVNRYELAPEDVANVVDPVADRNISFENMPSGEYDVPVIQDLYNLLYAKGITSSESALMVGCMVEVTDVNDLNKYITMAEESNASDVVEAFNVLRDGSYSHYWAFDKGLKNMGVESGCYVEGDALLTNKDGIYPNEEKGEEESSSEGTSETEGQGNGQGHGRS